MTAIVADAEKIMLGTSGWSYKEWIGPLYTKEDKSMLKAYSRVFKTVEIDSTFYRYPTKGMVMGWARYSPEGFVFTAKLPRLITHDKKLDLNQGIEQDLQKFIELMEPLIVGGKLGCILVQLPPSCHFGTEAMEDFFRILPTHVKFAVEFRHQSWIQPETWSLLERYKVAYTNVDEPLLPPEVHVTSDIAYFRWHGRGNRPWYDYEYKPDEIKPWIPKVKEASGQAKKVYGYFNNHFHGYAVENCLQVLEMLNALTPDQATLKAKVDDYFKSKSKMKEATLEAFSEPKKLAFEDLIAFLTAPVRLERAKEISDTELSIAGESDERVEAAIREYHIVIDATNKTLLHDCADWSKMLSTGKFCKHVAKLFLSLNRERATKLLASMYKENKAWKFKQHPAIE